MPRLPVLSGQDLIGAMERSGFAKARQSGSHVVMRRRTLGCVVPLHREIKVGTLAAIRRQAKLTGDDLAGATH